MRLSRKIVTTIGAVAIFAMFGVPVVSSITAQGAFQAGKDLGNEKNPGNILLLARGGNGNGGGGNGSGNGAGDGDRDRDRDRDGSCLDNVTSTTNATVIFLAGNSKGSGDQSRDHDHARDASCKS